MKKSPWYTYIVLGVILAGLAYFLYFKPKNVEISKIRANREKTEQEVKDLRIKKQQLDKIQKEIASLTATLKELESIIPLKKETDVILRRIQQIATDSRLDIIKFTPQTPANREFYAEWAIPIEITGNYHNLAGFFDRLNAFARLFTVEKFSIKALQNQRDELTISSAFTTKTYIFLEDASAPPADQKPPGKQQPTQKKPGQKQSSQPYAVAQKTGQKLKGEVQ